MIKRRILISLIVGLVTIVGMSWYVNTYIYNFFAATARVAVAVEPSVSIVQPNTEFTLGVSAANQPIDAWDLYVTYDPTKVEYLNKYTQLPIGYFTNEIVSETVTVLGKKQVHIALVSTNTLRQKSVRLNLQFKSLTLVGDAGFTVESKSQVTGVDDLNNPIQFEKDPAIATGKITVAIPTIPVPTNTVGPTPATCIPTLISPSRNSVVTTNPTFEWSACPGTGVKYRLEVAGNATPSTVLFVGTRYSFTNPLPAWVAGRTYSWKVKACPNADCIGGTFSTESQFSVPIVISKAPTPRPYVCGNADCSNKMYTVSPPILTSNAQQICVAKGWGVCAVCNVGYGPVSIHGWKPDTGSWSSSCPGASLGGFNPTTMEVCCTMPTTVPSVIPTVQPTAIVTIPLTIAPSVKPKVPPTISNITWTPQVPVSGNSVEGLITGTDTDSTQVTVEVYVSGQNIPETLFAKGVVAVSSGKWSYKAIKTLPGFVGTFSVYAVAKDEVNIVKSKVYTVTVLAPTPKDTCPRRFQGDANCDNTVNLIDVVCLRGEIIGQTPKNCVSSDFNNDKKVTIGDAPIWRSTYIKENTVQK